MRETIAQELLIFNADKQVCWESQGVQMICLFRDWLRSALESIAKTMFQPLTG